MATSAKPTVPTDFLLNEGDRTRLESAVEAAGEAADRLRGRRGVLPLRDCPVRTSFIRRSADDAERSIPAPMSRLLGRNGGRGGEVRLKLYLSLLWVSSGPPHATDIEAAQWARLIGLPQYSTRGKRRVLDAVNWLHDEGFIEKSGKAGAQSNLILRHDSGSGLPYTKPSDNPRSGTPSYRRLQSEFWTNGWIVALSGRAIAMWLTMLDQTQSGDDLGFHWVGETLTTKYYGLSPYLRQHGANELLAHGLLSRRRSQSTKFGGKKRQTKMAVRPAAMGELPRIVSES